MRHLPIPKLDSRLITLPRYWEKINKSQGCWLWTGACNGCNRGVYTLKNGKSYVAARIMYRLYYEVDPGKLCVCHTCDNTRCVNPEHLWLGTQLENIKDRDEKNHQNRPKGARNPRARLTPKEVVLIQRSTEKSSVLAKRFNITAGTIWRIRTGKRWIK